MEEKVKDIFNTWLKNEGADFSGVFSASRIDSGIDEVIYQQACGYRNKAEKLPNTPDTAFGIASGTKLFTGLAICKLIDEKKLSIEDTIWDLLPFDLGFINKNVTVYHLLTHTSGVGDYIDEEVNGGDEQLMDLYNKYPVHLWERLEYYLQMITPLPPKFEPGKRYAYSNAGFVLLGLIVETVSGLTYQQFVKENIITPCELRHTGFYRMDSLPANTALGYIKDDATGEWRANIFNMPILGGSDGGLFTCAKDLTKLWQSIFSYEIFSEEMAVSLLKPHVKMNGADEHSGFYGLGVYVKNNGSDTVYYAVGGDFGVDFFTAYLPKTKMVVSALGNTNVNTYPLLETLLETLK